MQGQLVKNARPVIEVYSRLNAENGAKLSQSVRAVNLLVPVYDPPPL